MNRVYNFNPGPATLPLAVLEAAQDQLLDYQGQGMSVMEMSHRSKPYEAINAQAEARIKGLLGLGDDYRVLFLQGGASLQFTMLPMNMLPAGETADYILTGSWSEKAAEEAGRVGQTHIAATTASEHYCRIPNQDEIALSANPAYVHITTNNTIYGSQWHTLPDVGGVPLVADASSDILSRPVDMGKFALVYAGAQKNLGPSGVTIVIVRTAWLEQASKALPVFLRYSTHLGKDSLYNTPPVFAVYMVNLVLGWIESLGGLEAMAERNAQKASTIYGVIDANPGFYRNPIQPESRSLMNITFRLPTPELEQSFLSGATAQGMIGLKGHRSVGGIRASIYNAMPQMGCDALAQFMQQFVQQYG
ncbi:MAG: 3-phosphoserine/phosphohydroxythreonine transaminase [Chloroflexaceae bacterium]|nr:3-phosphoserine/phosphohydroxythreonine transaminase [Chloroflexaceae bacterium]